MSLGVLGYLGVSWGNKTDLLLVVNVNNIRFSDISAKHFDHQENKQKNYTKIPNLSTTKNMCQRLKHFQRKDKIVKDFIILNQVVSEKTLMKNVHICVRKNCKKKKAK